eukprot:gene11586-biopygen8750
MGTNARVRILFGGSDGRRSYTGVVLLRATHENDDNYDDTDDHKKDDGNDNDNG